MLTAAQISAFARDGFVKGFRVLHDAGEIDLLNREVERVIADRQRADVPQPVRVANIGKPDSPVWQIVNIYQASSPFRRLLFHSDIAAAAAALLGARQLRVWHDQVQYKPAGTGGVNMWHQDSPYWPGLSPKDQQITAWVALDDAFADNGCMSMVPGSHQWGVTVDFLHTLKDFSAMPASFQGHDVAVKLCPVERGFVHFHHGLTWHGSHANTSGRPRRAIALHFMSDKTVYDGHTSHIMNQYIAVQPGQPIAGEHFPLVWDAADLPEARIVEPAVGC